MVPSELLVATVLSAQTTDLRVNQTRPALFAKYPTPEDLAAANPEELEDLVTLPGVGRKTANVVLGNAFDSASTTVARLPPFPGSE